MSEIPLEGDRSAFDCLNYPTVHATDLKAGTPIQHLPANGQIGYIPIHNGTYVEWQQVTFAAMLSYIILTVAATDEVIQFPATDKGLDDASAVAVEGDEIAIPPGVYTENHTFTSGVIYRGSSQTSVIFTGVITVGFDTSLVTFTIERSVSSSSVEYCLTGPSVGTGGGITLQNIICTINQAGIGNGYGIFISKATWYIVNSSLTGNSSGGSGYGIYLNPGDGGIAYLVGSPLTGSTAGINTFQYTQILPTTVNNVATTVLYSSYRNTPATLAKYVHNIDGTPANGLGIRNEYAIETSTTTSQTALYFDVTWTNVTHAARTSKLSIYTITSTVLAAHFVIAGDVVQMGDVAGGNYTEIENDGTLQFVGNATVWNDINFDALTLGAAASAPDNITFFGTGTILGPAFDGNVTTEQLYGGSELLHGYYEGTDITFHVHWMPTTANAGSVYWQLEYTWVNVDGTFPAPTTIGVSDAADGVPWKHQLVSFTAISGTGKEIGSQFRFRFFRVPTHGSDTYPDDAALLSLGIHYQIDTVGSRSISTK